MEFDERPIKASERIGSTRNVLRVVRLRNLPTTDVGQRDNGPGAIITSVMRTMIAHGVRSLGSGETNDRCIGLARQQRGRGCIRHLGGGTLRARTRAKRRTKGAIFFKRRNSKQGREKRESERERKRKETPRMRNTEIVCA